MAARRQAGAERGEADRRGAGAGRGQVPDRPGQRGEGRREVGVGTQQVGTEAVDEQDGHPAGAAQGGGEVERVGRQVLSLDGHAERRGHAGQHVGKGRHAVGRHRQVRRQHRGGTGHGRAARTCRPVAMSRKGEASARASSRARTACGAAPEVASRRSATTETPRHGPGRRPAPSTRASRPAGAEPAAGRNRAAGGGIAVLQEGQRLDRVAGDGPAQDGAGAVGRRDAHLAAGAQRPGDLAAG